MTAVSTVHSGRGTCKKCESTKLNKAAIVTLRERASWPLCSRTCVRDDLHSVTMRFMANSRAKVSSEPRRIVECVERSEPHAVLKFTPELGTASQHGESKTFKGIRPSC